jgi:hypothetical protein
MYKNHLLVLARHNSIPHKVSVLVWRVSQNKIAAKDNLHRRGMIGLGFMECSDEESVSHFNQFEL